jgi:ferredoxin, 2Fe-2S
VSDGFPVLVRPLNITLHCRSNEALIQCAWRSGYYWPTICGGIGECGACQCTLVEGNSHAEPMKPIEALFFGIHPSGSRPDKPVRLACCMTVTGPITVHKDGVRPK